MILLIGIPSEPPLQMVKQALDSMRTDSIIFNQRHFEQYDLRLEIYRGQLGGNLYIEGQNLPLQQIKGAYARPMDDTQLPELVSDTAGLATRQHCRSLHELLMRWLQIAPGRIVNRPSAMASNSSKPYQMWLIKHYGFDIPETLITNDPMEVMRFRDKHKRIIFKSISGVRSMVTEFRSDDIERLDLIRWCPTQFQQRLEGFDVRVHVVGELVFATRAMSSATDYRYSTKQGGVTKIEEYCLPPSWEERCIALSKGLGMSFTGIDLKVTPEGAVYCFEVNPCPAFSYYEEQTGQPIADAVAKYLSNN